LDCYAYAADMLTPIGLFCHRHRALLTVVCMAQANQIKLAAADVAAEVEKCVANFGDGTCVDETGFVKYAASLGDMFMQMASWREVFDRYASKDDEMQESDALQLVKNILTCNGQTFTEAEAQKFAQDMWEVADKDMSGSICFAEFVQYAKIKPELFANLRKKILSPHTSPRKQAHGSDMDVDTRLVVEAAARKLFAQADADGSNSLDGSELECVVRDLARANRRYLTVAEVAAEVSQCITTFGDGAVVQVDGFIKYVEARSHLFGKLDLWKDVFNQYTSRGPNGLQMYPADARRLVTDVLRCNGQSCAAKDVEDGTQAMLAVADSDNDGSVSFAEFVKYATDERFAHMFQKLCAEIRSPQKGPAAAGGAAANMPDLDLADAAMDDMSESAARKLFREADKDGNGTLDADELRQVCVLLL